MSNRDDRLYQLLPAVYRERDQAAGEPLRALLGIIAEQVNLIEDDIAQLYDNWFIETCEPWVVPYIGDLLGYRALHAAQGDAAETPVQIVAPRRDVANTIGYRRRKGSAAVLADIAASVSGWPCRLVEFDRRLAGTQSLRHLQLARGRLASVRDPAAMGRIDSPWDDSAHTIDLRRPQSARTQGRHSLNSIAVFVWRLQSFPVTRMQAYCIDRSEAARYTFSVLGNDVPLFASARPTRAGGEPSAPAALTRAGLRDAAGHPAEQHYGEGRSLALWRRDGQQVHLVARHQVLVADLGDWQFEPPRGFVAVDPECGRIAFADEESPEHGLLVSYHYGAAAALGGGEYTRPIVRPAAGSRLYAVGPDADFASLDDALKQWHDDQPHEAVIELSANDVHVDPKPISLRDGQRLEIRAAAGVRPLIDLRNRLRDAREFLGVRGGVRSRLRLDGLLIAGRGLQLRGHMESLSLHHCTFVPGWDVDEPRPLDEPVAPSIRLDNVPTRVLIDKCIVGPIVVVSTSDDLEPLALTIVDSIVDATSPTASALGASDSRPAWVTLTALRSTFVGEVDVDGIDRAEDALFDGRVDVTRRQQGCVRFCLVPTPSRTPQRHACQPDLALAAAPPSAKAQVLARLRSSFTSRRYGSPGYLQLSGEGAVEIAAGAHDLSEIGVYHDLFQPQRLADLRARLDEYAPAGCDAGIIKAS
ncbi:MAG: hypothetical protein AB3X44_21610 [Leptothrix sp. (in: b-proteobacteria)]